MGQCYVEHPDGVTRALLDQAAFEVEVASERVPVRLSLRPFYDPKRLRVRS